MMLNPALTQLAHEQLAIVFIIFHDHNAENFVRVGLAIMTKSARV